MKCYRLKCFIDPLTVNKFNSESGKNIVDEMICVIEEHKPYQGTVVLNKFFSGFDILLFTEEDISDNNADEIIGWCKAEVCDCQTKKTLEEVDDSEIHHLSLSKAVVEKIKQYFPDKSDDNTSSETDLTDESDPDYTDDSSDTYDDDVITEDDVPSSENDGVELIESVRNLVGMDELKKWAEMVFSMKDKIVDPKLLQHALFNMSYLLVINSGNGCSVCGNIIGNVIAYVLNASEVSTMEHFITFNEKEGTSNVSSVANKFEYSKNDNKVIVHIIHIGELLNKTNSDGWFELLKKVRDNNENAVFVFTIPVIENAEIARIHQKIDDIVCNRVIVIPPYSNEDYLEIFDNYFKRFGIKVDPEAHSALIKKLAEEKSDGNFYGIKTVQKICDELIYNKVLNFALDDNVNEKTIVAQDILNILINNCEDGISGLEKLDSLVALQNVKEMVREIIASIKMKRHMNSKENNSMHMMFAGPPGTGKTVVARIIGRIFKEEGLLSIGDFYEVSRKDLVGSYVGHTAPKTAAVCKNAYGSVLFIDEAYSLAGGSDVDYGREAISTLIAEMENNRDNFVVIFAGYRNDLDKLFDLNSGLRDRIPYIVDFKSYNRDELKEIFIMNFSDNFEVDEEFVVAADEFFKNFSSEILGSPNFSNGRFVRNLAERVISKAALRLASQNNYGDKIVLTKYDFDLAVNDIGLMSKDFNNEKTRKIGFAGVV